MNKRNQVFSTGLSGLDELLNGLLPGDNVVLQVGSIDEYMPFVEPFYKRAVADGHQLIYFRFGRHRQLVEPSDGVKIHYLQPEEGFERFIGDIIEIIGQAGSGACYVFDCLSGLAVDWYSDRMLGNFFMLTCPYLYSLDTIAYFAVFRNNHSSLAIDAITQTAQVVMTIYSHRERLYVQPLKVFNRYSPNMYILNRWDDDTFRPLTNSGITAEILTQTPQPWLDFTIHRPEVWMRTFMRAQDALDKMRNGDMPQDDLDKLHNRLLRMAITRQEKFIDIARKYLPLSRLFGILQRMIGTGLIGGKSLGMLLARAILEDTKPEWKNTLEPHDSFFVGSDVFYTFLVQNACWWYRYEQKSMTMDELLKKGSLARANILKGTFPEDIQHQFTEMLNYFGQSPIIVRSSSLLEDNYGNAFSGKYESVFCANQGTPEERLEKLLNAVRTVYASTMSCEALTYRADRGLLDQDEQMALLIQRVSGNMYDGYFFPQMAGVGFSFNMYAWNKEIDPTQGMLRMVLGLGTRAVDRTADDYTRIVALNSPFRRPEAGTEDEDKYVQRYAEVLDLEANSVELHELNNLMPVIPDHPKNLLTVPNPILKRLAQEQGSNRAVPRQLSFDRVFKQTSFIDDMREMLNILQTAYGNPVDVEFTANITEGERYRLNLVQCRPLQVEMQTESHRVHIPEQINEEAILLESPGPVIGRGLAVKIDRLIYVVPEAYAELRMQQRYKTARLIGELTHLQGEQAAEHILLIGPGRWGTRSPTLGVPVAFSEINTITAVCEVALMREGLVPDISLGTHFFNDLVEMDMVYLAVSPEKEGNRISFEQLKQGTRPLDTLLPHAKEQDSIIRITDSKDLENGESIYLYADPVHQKAICTFQTA